MLKAEFDILYGEGISREGDTLDLSVEQKIVEKSGAWYSFDGERLGQGRENVRAFLKENPSITKEIDKRVRQGLGLPVVADPAPATDKEKESAAIVNMPKKKAAGGS
jgi:recombination protein RecA